MNKNNVRECYCKAGFTLKPESIPYKCIDVDECDQSTSGKICQWKCTNTYGSFKCSCPKGYERHPENPRQCVNVDECARNLHNCRAGQMCHDTFGAFTCVNKDLCPQNYTLTAPNTCSRSPCYLNNNYCNSLAHQIHYIPISLPANIKVPLKIFKKGGENYTF